MLHHNKLYQSLKKVSGDWHAGHVDWFFSWNYFKFFDDGNFITASIAGNNIEEINIGFTIEKQNITKGKFKIDGRSILLSINNIDIQGYINNDRSIIIEGKVNWDILYPVN